MANSSFDSGRDNFARQNGEQSQGNDWHPDLSRERPEWRAAHANQKNASLDVTQDGLYIVKDGDTIYDIARRALTAQNCSTDAASVKQEISKIIQSNADAYPRLSDNPDLIHAGDQLRLNCTDAAVNVPPSNADQTYRPVSREASVDPEYRSSNTIQSPDATTGYEPNQRIPYQPNSNQTYTYGDDYGVNRNSNNYQPREDYVVDSGRYYGDRSNSNYPPRQDYVVDSGRYYGDRSNSNYPPDGDYVIPGRDYGVGRQENYQPENYGSYADQEAARLSQMMVNNPHAAASELRDQIQRLDPQAAGELIAKTKNDEYVGGLGDLQIQVEFDQYGRDSGYRNVTMATPDGIEQIAEIQSRPQYRSYANDLNPLSFVAGVIVGDLLWQQQRGLDFNDDRYRGWCNREQYRENYWNNNNGQFMQNWQNPEYRHQYQSQNWQQVANNPNIHNTYITNNRYDTTINNRTVNNTIINETINNTKNINNSRRTVQVGEPVHRLTEPAPITGIQHGRQDRPVQINPAQTLPIGQQPRFTGQQPQPHLNGQPPHFTPGERGVGQNTQNTQQQQELAAARERAAQLQHQQDAARERTTQLQQQQDAARERTAQLQHQQDAARERTAQLQHQQDAARERTAQLQQQQDAARERTAQFQHQQDAARDRAAQLQHQQDLQHANDMARIRESQQHQQVPVVPPGHKA